MIRTPLRRDAARVLATSAIACALVATAGCNDATARSGGRVSILLTDAPGDFEKAVVTISEIYLQGEGGRVVLRSEPVTTDLLTLANSTAELVKDAPVPTGSYSQLRFVVTGGYIQVAGENGTTRIFATSPDYAGLPAGAQVTGTLHMPSFSQSGMKVKLPGETMAVSEGQRVMLVDFDVSRSFGKEAGNSGRWVMSPVLEATDFSFSGALKVTLGNSANVALPAGVTLAGAKAAITNTTTGGSDVPQPFTDADGDGVFEARFAHLIPGTYKVTVMSPAGATLTTNPAEHSVGVVPGPDATAAFQVTAAVAAPPAP